MHILCTVTNEGLLPPRDKHFKFRVPLRAAMRVCLSPECVVTALQCASQPHGDSDALVELLVNAYDDVPPTDDRSADDTTHDALAHICM